jgi:UDP-glucose 4-epimerase
MITGVSRHLGGKLAQRLEDDPGVEYVVGVDLEEPEVDLRRAEFVQADIRNPLIAKIIQATEVDTLVHLSIISTPTRVGGRSAMKEINVIGSLQLFAACQKAPALRKVVMKSSTAVYGASPRDPAFFTEDMTARSMPRHGFAKDSVEVEQYVRDLGRRRRDVSLTILRFANFIGSEIETSLTRYFSLPLVPTPIGYDPRLQFVHEEDAEEVLFRATRDGADERRGIFNVAADGVVLLSQAVRICGKLPLKVPLPLASPLAGGLRRLRLVDFPTDQIPLLVYGRVADNHRLKTVFGHRLRYTTREALEEFVKGRRFRRFVTPETAAAWEQEAYDFLRRTRAERERARR